MESRRSYQSKDQLSMESSNRTTTPENPSNSFHKWLLVGKETYINIRN
jgi:hypothetical protein